MKSFFFFFFKDLCVMKKKFLVVKIAVCTVNMSGVYLRISLKIQCVILNFIKKITHKLVNENFLIASWVYIYRIPKNTCSINLFRTNFYLDFKLVNILKNFFDVFERYFIFYITLRQTVKLDSKKWQHIKVNLNL